MAARAASENPAVKSIILLNPAIVPPGADVSQFKGVPHGILSEMTDHQLLSKKIHAYSSILLGTQDEEIPRDWVLDFAVAQESTVRFLKDDHGFTHNLTRLPRIVTELLPLRE